MRTGRRSMAFGLLALLAFSAVARADMVPTPCTSPSPTPCASPSPSPSPACQPSPKPSPVCASPPPPKCDPFPPPPCASPPPPKCDPSPPPPCASPPPPKCDPSPPPPCASPPPPKCDPSPSPSPVCKPSPSPSPVCKPSPSPSPVCKPSPSPSPTPACDPSPSPSPVCKPSPSPSPSCQSPSPSPTPCASPSPSPSPSCQSPSPSPSCDKKPPKPVPSPVPVPSPPKCLTAYDLLASTPQLSVLKTAVDNAGLAAALQDPNFVGTIFAPTNYAVSVCWATGCLTQNVILYHAIIGGAYTALGLFKFGNPVSYYMGNGGIATMTLNQITRGVTVSTQRNNASVIVPNIPFCGGYVHIIDTVLDPRPLIVVPPSPPLPPATCRPTAYDTISAYPQLAGFKALLDRTGRAALLQRDFAGTIFAPIVTWVGLPGTNETLTVDNHLIPLNVLSYPSGLAGQVLTAASGLKLTVVSQTNLIYNTTSPVPVNLRLTTPDGAYADFLNPGFVNIQACGYVIHFISIPLWSPVQTIG